MTLNTVTVTDMSVAATQIDGLAIVTLKQIADERGTVREFFRISAYGDGLHGENMVKLVSFDDDLGISWPIPIDGNDRSQVSAKDAAAPRFRKS